MSADTCTSPFFTMRIDSRRVRLYVTCIAIVDCKSTNFVANTRTIRNIFVSLPSVESN